MKRTDQSSNAPKKKPKAAFLGVGFDNKDEQTRITRGKNFLLYGGSEETHSVMQETAVKVNEKLDHRGKRLNDVSSEEFREMLCDISESIGVKPPRRDER
ncbi:MAG: hypothetical protein LBJ67_05110 [Planctomycetaceae bacterium]|jgi:hypothetical protein|nr:hypothetical protein [Planctomycetaceae bacterium]